MQRAKGAVPTDLVYSRYKVAGMFLLLLSKAYKYRTTHTSAGWLLFLVTTTFEREAKAKQKIYS